MNLKHLVANGAVRAPLLMSSGLEPSADVSAGARFHWLSQYIDARAAKASITMIHTVRLMIVCLAIGNQS